MVTESAGAVSRRSFVAGLAAGAVMLRGRPTWAADTQTTGRKGSDVVGLGHTGLRPTLLGMGCGTNSGNQQRSLPQEQFTRLIRHGLERGLRFVDTADAYNTQSMVRKALIGVPRDKYFLLSKSFSRRPELMQKDVDRFLAELGVEYLDCLLIHCVTAGNWPVELRPVIDALQQAKKAGKIKAVGVSCHGFSALEAAAEAEGIDVHLARINPFGKVMDAEPEKVVPVLRKMHQSGRGVIGMKIFGNTGLNSSQERLQSIKYVLGLGCVDCFTIGCTSVAQLDETLELIEKASA